MKIKKGDNIIVIAGKHKGEKGTVVRTLRDTDRVIVEGINKIKRHLKKTRGQKGQIIEREAALHNSNVQVIDPKSGKASRIGVQIDGSVRTRVAKKSGQALKS